MIRHFIEESKRRDPKVNANKSKVMVLGGEKRIVYEISVDRCQLQYVSECFKKVEHGKKVVGAIESLVNFQTLQDE